MQSKDKATIVAEALRHDILHGKLASGERLNQVWLAERFGVSRIPVREALRRLEAEGYVLYRQNREALVTGLSQQDVFEALEIRSYLEPAIMRHCVPNLTDGILDDASAVLNRIERTSDLSKLRGMHTTFHTILYNAAGRPKMAQIINDNRLSIDRAQEQKLLKTFIQKCAGIHRRLLQACRARNTDKIEDCVKAELTLLRGLI